MRFPDLRIILGHAGGGIYVLEAVVAASVCPNIYVELSSLMPHHVNEVFAHVSADRLMIGSDLPESVSTEIGKILDLDIPREAKEKILWQTGENLFQDHR
jgi:predicted TIM-barrel fold metal-dependent hydrolase